MTIKCPNEFECQFFIFSERLCVRERESEERERESKFMGEGGRERVRAVRNIIERIWRLFRHSLFPLRNFFPFLHSEPPPPSPPRPAPGGSHSRHSGSRRAGGGIPTGESWRAVERRWPPLMAERGNLKIGKDGECKHRLKTELGKIFERTRTEKFFNQSECWEEAHF